MSDNHFENIRIINIKSHHTFKTTNAHILKLFIKTLCIVTLIQYRLHPFLPSLFFNLQAHFFKNDTYSE